VLGHTYPKGYDIDWEEFLISKYARKKAQHVVDMMVSTSSIPIPLQAIKIVPTSQYQAVQESVPSRCAVGSPPFLMAENYLH